VGQNETVAFARGYLAMNSLFGQLEDHTDSGELKPAVRRRFEQQFDRRFVKINNAHPRAHSQRFTSFFWIGRLLPSAAKAAVLRLR